MSSSSCLCFARDRTVLVGAGGLVLDILLGDLSSPLSLRFLRDRGGKLEASFGPLSETLFAAIDQAIILCVK